MSALETRYGAASSLADFERKAQLMNYVTYRAIFEGFQAHLWTGNSGRLLWMTHPAWPSNAWQIYTSDYDAAAAYYAVAKACEPLHVQMDLPDFRPVVVNTTRLAQTGLKLRTRIVSLDNRPLLDRETRVDAKPNDITVLEPLALKELLLEERVVLVQLTLSNSRGALSSNLYWQAADPADERRLVGLPDPKLAIRATRNGSGEGSRIEIRIDNPGATPALLTRLTLLDANGKRVLPAYYSENYVSVLPHESRIIEAQCPAQGKECASLTVRGWNVPEKSVSIREH
jgi:hypothetical protein